MKTVLVTGARGTVGGYVVQLAEAAGYRVIASDLTSAGVRVPARGEVRPADLRDPAACEALVRGCDYVIHTAAQLDLGVDPAELTKANTDAVVQLYESSQRAGVRRFVHTSTATLYAEPTDRPLVETHPLAPRGPYTMSKHGAEVFLRGREGGDGPIWTIIRPAPFYGRRGRHFAAGMLALGPLLRLASPIVPLPLGGPVGTMAHAEDVAGALLFVLERPETHWQVYNVSDGDPMALGDRLRVTYQSYGLRYVEVGPLPRGVFSFTGRLFSRPLAYRAADASALSAWGLVVLRHGLKPALRPRMDREAMTLLYEDLVVDAGKLRALGWEPRFPRFADGWKSVLKWYQAETWVPRYG